MQLPINTGNNSAAAPKILFACMAGDGHFNPLTGLAVHLQNAGYDVRWYVGQAYAQKLKKLNIFHYPQTRAQDFTVDNINELLPERSQQKSGLGKLKFDLIHFFMKRGPDFYADLKEIHQLFPFELLVADITFTAIPFVKEKMKIPVLSVGIMPIAETSKNLAPMGLGLTPSYTFFGQLKQCIMRWVTDAVLLRGPIKIWDDLLAAEGIQHQGNMFDTMYAKSTLVLQSGTPGFEYRRSDLNPKIRWAGALLPVSKQQSKGWWYHPKMSQYKKVLLVTQGTAEPDVEKLIVPTLEAFKNTQYLVVVTTAGNHTAALRQRYPQANFIIEDFIPFSDIMPLAHAYISNGGYGGVMLSICNQLPMVVAGVNEGKNEICARVGFFGLGINVKTETPTPLQLKTAVEKILGDNTYKKAVTALSHEFNQYNPAALCEQYVQELLHNHTLPARKMRSQLAEEIY